MSVVAAWRRWTKPSPALTDRAVRWRARLLASVILLGLPLMAIVVATLFAASGGEPHLPAWVLLIPLGGLTGAYALARTRHWRAGVWLAAASMSLPAAMDVAIHHRIYTVLYVGLAIALAGMMLRKRDCALMVGLVLAWWLTAPLWSSSPFTGHETAVVASFFVALGFVLAISVGLREAIEQARLDELAKSEANYRELLEATFEGLVVIKDDQIIDLNPGFVELCGRERSAVLGRALSAVLTIDEADDTSDAAETATGTRPDGEVFHVELVSRVQNTARGPVQYVAVRNVTEQRQATLQLSMAHRAVAMGTLSSGIAREIDNPLSWMMTNLRMAQEELLDETRVRPGDPAWAGLRSTLDDAVQGGRRVMSIVRDLKTLSREDDRTGSADIHTALDLACRVASRPIEARARLVRDYGHVPTVVGAAGRLGQVFLNLLGNAVEAIPKGERERHRIVLRTRQAGDMVEVTVRDSGRGITSSELPHVFDPFYTTVDETKGSRGLGLSIARSIVDSLGGSIEVDSRLGEGATFTVRLPVAERASRATALPTKSGTKKGATATGNQAKPTLISSPHPIVPVTEGKARVLIIDDEPLLGKSLCRALREHDVTFTEDPAHALDLCGATDFDVIVCDLLMPIVSGEDVYRHLQEHAPELATRVIFMTGGAFTEGAQKFLRDVPNEVLNKPFAPRDLSVAVRRMLDAHTPARALGS